MATDPLNARVAAIVDQLQALTHMAPGMSVKADDWNTVVGAMVDIARLLTSGALTTPPHTHVGQVGRDWLDPTLTDFVETTRQTQQAQAQQLQSLTLRMDRVEARLAGFDDRVGSLQSSADREADAGLDRDILLKRIGERVTGHDLLSSQLGDLRTRIVQLEPRIDAAVALRDELSGPNGQLPDIAGLQGQVKELGVLRDNLRLADGSIGRLRDLERRLDTFQEIGTDDAVLNARIDAGVAASLAASGLSANAIAALVETRVNPVAADVRELQSANDALQARVTQQDSSLSAATGRLGALENLSSLTAELPARVASLEAFRGTTSAELTKLRADVDANIGVREQLGVVTTGLSDVSARLDSFATRVALSSLSEQVKSVTVRATGIEQQITSLATQDQLAQLSARVEGSTRDLANVDASVQLLQAGITDLRRTTDTRLQNLDGRVNGLRDANANLALDLGKISQRIDGIRVPVIVGGRGGPG